MSEIKLEDDMSQNEEEDDISETEDEDPSLRCLACNAPPNDSSPWPYCHFCGHGLHLERCQCDGPTTFTIELCEGCDHERCPDCEWLDNDETLACCQCDEGSWDLYNGSIQPEDSIQCQCCPHNSCGECALVIQSSGEAFPVELMGERTEEKLTRFESSEFESENSDSD